jgi:hypothetical protein
VEKISEITKKNLEGKIECKYSPIASKHGVTDVIVQEFVALIFAD